MNYGRLILLRTRLVVERQVGFRRHETRQRRILAEVVALAEQVGRRSSQTFESYSAGGSSGIGMVPVEIVA